MRGLLALLTVSILPALAADVSGTWKLEGNLEAVRISRVCTLQQTASKLAGKCRNQTDEVTLAGEVDGTKVAWKYDVMYEGLKLTLTFQGTLDPETAMKGTIETTGAKGRFTARKQ